MNNYNYNFNLLEFGGTGNLIATAICDFENSGTVFKKGDTVLDLEGVGIHFNYGSHTSDLKSSRNQIYYNEYYLDSFIVDMAPFNLQAQKLFANMTEEELIIVSHENPISMMGQVLLVNIPEEDQPIVISGIEQFELVINNGVAIIRSDEFEDGKNYHVYYRRKIKCNTIELDNENADIPYLQVQIQFTGNSDKQTIVNYFSIEKVSLRFTPVFNLKDNAVSHLQLMFKVIEGDTKPKLSVSLDG
jgi:hypothetical protein